MLAAKLSVEMAGTSVASSGALVNRMYQQLLGNNAAAIYDPRTGLRFMNDLATYEIFWHFLYLTVFHGVELTAEVEERVELGLRHVLSSVTLPACGLTRIEHV